MQDGAIAPESNMKNLPVASSNESDEEPKEFQDILNNDNVTVKAVNKYTPDDDIEESNKKYPAVVDEAVLSKPSGDDSGVKGVTAPSPDPSSSTPSPQHPPSFFTDHRGNLKAVNVVVRNPCLIFSLIIGLCILISFLLQVIVFRAAAVEGRSPITLTENEFDLADLRSIQYDSFRLARDEVKEMKAALADTDSKKKDVPKQSEFADVALWVFEADTENTDKGVFGTADSIRGMKEAYDIFLGSPDFKNYCMLDYQTPVAANETRKCRAPLSPLTMYYASYWDEEKAGDVIEQLKDPAKVELFNTLATCVILKQFCEKKPESATPEEELWTSQLWRDIQGITANWDMEGPLVENFDHVTEFASYMKELELLKGTVSYGFDNGFSTSNPVSDFSRGMVFWGGPLADFSSETSDEDAKEIWETDGDQRKDFVKANYLDKMNNQSEKGTHDEIDSYYFMGALILDVLIDILTKDAILALFSFAFVVIWLRVTTKSWFLAWVGFFEIAFSIPIAWFLFTVVFQIKYFAPYNTLALFIVAAIGADDIFIFMDAYKQSRCHPEILVDLETRMSWIYRRTGTAMAITSATTCAAFLCTLITPLASLQSFGIFAAFVILIDYVLVMTLFCTAVVIYHNRYENSARFGCCCPCGLVDPNNTEEARLALEGNEGEIETSRTREFFKVKVAGFIMVPLHRLILGILFLVWLAIAIWQMSLIEATKESEQVLDENHPLQKSISILTTHFPPADDDDGLKVHFAVGVDEVDRTGVNLLLDPENFGSPNFVAGFDFNIDCQKDLVNFCDELKTAPEYKDLIKRKNGLGLVYCFVEELAAYNVKGDLTGDKYCDHVRQGAWKNQNWQVNPNDLNEIIPRFLKEKSCFDENGLETNSERYHDEIGWNGVNLVYASISAESNVLLPFGADGEAKTRREYDQFFSIAEEQDKIISKSCGGGAVIMTDLDTKFVFMNNQSIYVRSAILSAILGVVIAFGVILISTRVFHLALFASISILCVLVSVVGTMVMLGWTLGVVESVLIGITAGFSVDYVVHLAHAYEIASGDTSDRITEAFSDLGTSVFNGMVTSVAASIPLFFCKLQFYSKFGTFLCLTIAYSWIFANFGFMTLLAQLKIPLKEKGCRL